MGDETGNRNARRKNIFMDGRKRRIWGFIPKTSTGENIRFLEIFVNAGNGKRHYRLTPAAETPPPLERGNF